MKRLPMILTLLTINQYCFSQTGTIKGHVHDIKVNEGLAFANVFLIDQNFGATTDVNGDFIIDHIPVGTYDLKVCFVGCRDTTIYNIEVANDSIIDLHIDFPPPCRFDPEDKTCPICQKQDKVIPIAYGFPGKKLMKQAEKGRVRLGGCVISGCDPSWYCIRDKKEF